MASYQIIREIGRGGMATICEATRHCGDLEQVVAIKRILPELRADESIRARFRQEAELCMQLAHPNIVRAYDLDADKKKDLIIVMELVDGVSLEKLAGKVELTPPLIRLILAHLLRALAHTHGRGILHRDISPKNILISRNGEVKLADFGLAKRMDSPCTEPGFKGTAAYASPAVVQGGEADVYADLYSLAALGYWMLTKAPPYFYGPLPQLVRRMSQGSIPPLPENAPAELGGLITSLLNYMKERTFHSAEQVEDALTQHTEPMASPEELATLVRQAMNLDLPADEQPDMERAETRQAASRHPDRADAAHRSPVRQRRQWLAIAAIWLGAVSAAVLWMQYGSTQQEPSTGRSGDAPVTASMAEEPPAPEAHESIAPREHRDKTAVIGVRNQDEPQAPDSTDSAPSRQTDYQDIQSPSPSSQRTPREYRPTAKARSMASTSEATAVDMNEAASATRRAETRYPATWTGQYLWLKD